MRAKWSAPIRKYWKISEQMMVKYCDLTICDSVNIEKYIHECYDGKGISIVRPQYNADRLRYERITISHAGAVCEAEKSADGQ